MRTRITVLMLAMLTAASGIATAQTGYYQTTTTYNLGGGVIFNSDVRESGMVTLYRSTNRFAHVDFPTEPDGTLPHPDFLEGRKKSVIMNQQQAYLDVQARVRQAFRNLGQAERQAIKDDGRRLSITLYLDPVTAKPVEVEFEFGKEQGWRYVSPYYFWLLEQQLLATPIATTSVHPDAKRLNFVSIIWLQELPAEAEPNITVKKAFDDMIRWGGVTPLPYYHDFRAWIPYSEDFPVEQQKDHLDTRQWNDLQLTQPENNFSRGQMIRAFNSAHGNNYRIGLVVIGGAGNASKLLLVTATAAGAIIDYLEVGYSDYHPGVRDKIVVKQFDIGLDPYYSSHTRVNVYQIRPTSATPVPFNNNDMSFVGERLDTAYWIGSTGKFIKRVEYRYVPKTYQYQYLKRGQNIFRNGGENTRSTLQYM